MLITVPSPSDIVAQISPTVSGIFGDLAPVAYLIIGISLGIWFIGFLIGAFRNTFSISKGGSALYGWGGRTIKDNEFF